MAEEEGDTKFVSCLDKASLKKAKDELSERNDKDRVMAVHTLRQWINDVKDVRTPTDISFLLRFLRVKKFSQLEARKRLEHYWAAKTKRPEWFRDMDPADPDLQKAFRSGKFRIKAVALLMSSKSFFRVMCLPMNRDKHNRRLVIVNFGKMTADLVKDVGRVNMYRMFACVTEWLATDEHAQVNGLVNMSDYSNFTMHVVTAMFNADEFKDYMSFLQKGVPLRIKSMNVYNEPSFFDLIFSLFTPFLSQKLRSRYTFHGKSIVKMYDEVGYECLPDEYLPDDYEGTGVGTINECIEEMIADMVKPEFRDYIRDLSSDKYGVNKDETAAKHHENASYRKLNID